MTTPISPGAIYELANVSGPALSSDGTRLAFARSSIDLESMDSRSMLLEIALPDGVPVLITDGPKDTVPCFSPDGTTLAFLRSDENDKPQLWMVPTTGGQARQLTSVAGGIAEYAWSPDSQTFVFGTDIDGDYLLKDYDSKKNPRVRIARRIRYRIDTIGWRGDAHRHLFLINNDGTDLRQLTDGDADDFNPVWSPNGDRIAFISDRGEDHDFVPYTQVYVVPKTGGTPTCWSPDVVTVVGIAWSPEGDRLAAVGSQDKEIGPGWQGWIFIIGPGQTPIRLTDGSMNPSGGFLPFSLPTELRWTNEDEVIFIGDRRGQSYLCIVSVGSGKLQTLGDGGASFTGVTFDGPTRRAVVTMLTPSSAGELALVDITTGSMHHLISLNEIFLKKHPPARQEKWSFDRGGIEIECRLYLPPDHDPNGQYPVILDIHGGPHGVFSDTFNLVQQVLATAGYLVLCVNPRGSSTYGANFAKAVLRDWGGEDYWDLMEAVEQVCERPDVDGARLGVHGYSYGGYMSSWIVGQTNRFAAAVVGAPCTDLPALYGTSDIGISFGEVQWGGLRKQSEQTWLKRSPISYADRVETPVLLLHGEADYRVPIAQSEAYFVALKRLGKEVEFVRFPDSSHSFLRNGHPRMREEYLTRMLGWFDTHVGRSR